MLPTLVLTRIDQVRALADPLRLRIVEALVPGDASVAQLAEVVGLPVTRLYHHVDLLLDAGLIEVVDRIRRRGAEERRFRAAARRFTMDGSLLELAPGPEGPIEGLIDLARSILGPALDEVVEGLRDGRIQPGTAGRGLVLQDRGLRLSAEGFAALATELPAWLEQFARRHRSASGTEYRLALAAFPGKPGTSRKRSPKRRQG